MVAAVGLGAIAPGVDTVAGVQSTTISGSDTGGGAMGLAIAMILGLTLGVIGVGLVILASVVRGRGQFLMRSGPDSEYRLVLAGSVLLAVGPVVGFFLVFFGGLGMVVLPAALGVHLVAVGAVLRAATVVHRTYMDSLASFAENPATRYERRGESGPNAPRRDSSPDARAGGCPVGPTVATLAEQYTDLIRSPPATPSVGGDRSRRYGILRRWNIGNQ